jgi:hypothetical protein
MAALLVDTTCSVYIGGVIIAVEYPQFISTGSSQRHENATVSAPAGTCYVRRIRYSKV